MERKTILVDFDGTLNSYKTGFDARRPHYLPDPPNPGAIGFLRRLMAGGAYTPVIFTTRALILQTGQDNPDVQEAVVSWLIEHGLERQYAEGIRVTALKLPCSLIVDDNAWRYEGRFPTVEELAKLTRSK